MEINQNVRNIRESKGVTQTHVAKQLGVTVQTYNAYEMGRRQLKAETLRSISEILNEPIQNFFTQRLYETKNKQLV